MNSAAVNERNTWFTLTHPIEPLSFTYLTLSCFTLTSHLSLSTSPSLLLFSPSFLPLSLFSLCHCFHLRPSSFILVRINFVHRLLACLNCLLVLFTSTILSMSF